MKKAIVIGVGKYAHLKDLDSVAGAEAVSSWLSNEGYSVDLITDAEKKVTTTDIYDAIEKVLDKGNTTHLLVYFTGHGYLNSMNEIWLLSDAPKNPAAAINLSGTIEYARLSNVPNVTFISDACRSTPDSMQANAMQGVLVFPSPTVGTKAGQVDRWFATQPGTPAFELPLEKSIDTFSSAYTRVFVDAHSNAPESIIQKQTVGDQPTDYIPSYKLRDYLNVAVPELLLENEIYKNQVPSAVIESDPDFFLCPYRPPRVTRGQTVEPPVIDHTSLTRTTESRSAQVSINASLRRSVDSSLADQTDLPIVPTLDDSDLGSITAKINATIASVPGVVSEEMDSLLGSVYTVAKNTHTSRESLPPGAPPAAPSLDYSDSYSNLLQSTFKLNGRNSFETETGFSVFGSKVKAVYGLTNDIEEPNDARVDVRMYPTEHAHTILIQFEDESGAALPCLRGFIGTILVGDDGISNITFQRVYDNSDEKLNQLRASVAAASNFGVFTVDKHNGQQLANQIRQGKSADPTLGIYACYAYQQVGMMDSILSVQSYMQEFNLFDIDMLARRPFDEAVRTSEQWQSVVPFCPMLSQGWDLIEAKQLIIPKLLLRASAFRKSSLWTTFKPEGMKILIDGIQNGEI